MLYQLIMVDVLHLAMSTMYYDQRVPEGIPLLKIFYEFTSKY